jgi:hypothetical protein
MKEKDEHGLSESELFLASAWDDGEEVSTPPPLPSASTYSCKSPQAEFVYFATKVKGGRIEIEGEPSPFLSRLIRDVGDLIAKAIEEN